MLLFFYSLPCVCLSEGERVGVNITIIFLPPGGRTDDPQSSEFTLSPFLSVSSVVVFCNLGFFFHFLFWREMEGEMILRVTRPWADGCV